MDAELCQPGMTLGFSLIDAERCRLFFLGFSMYAECVSTELEKAVPLPHQHGELTWCDRTATYLE